MSDELPLAGRLALVTGASRGLGAEIARRLFADGANLLLAARDATALHHVADALDSRRVKVFPVDLSYPADVERFLEFCAAQAPGIEIVVNNAAITGPIGDFEKTDFAAWRHVFQTNFFAPARICQRLIEPMRHRGRGKIINISGGGATAPRPRVSAYGASKCALVRFSETLAVELKGTGIDVNCVAPGAMNTRMLQDVLDAGPAGAAAEYEKALRQRQTGGAAPANAAELVSFLASAAGDGITGRLISALWDDWRNLPAHRDELAGSDVYTLRRIVPEDRKK
jgi:NAD(P)-dependent dehydrogenase (short-subunit alcohol dehydrogenase family)